MLIKIKDVFGAFFRYLKARPIVAAIPAAILGVAAATVVTAAVIKHFKSGKPEKYLSSLSLYTSSASDTSSVPFASETQEVSSAAVIQPVKKSIEYKGKSIDVPKVEVAKKKLKRRQ